VAYREPHLFDTDRDRQGWCPRRRRPCVVAGPGGSWP